MGHIEFNTSDIKLCLGAAEVSAAYLGDEQVYPIDEQDYFSVTNDDANNGCWFTLDSYKTNFYLTLDLEYSYDKKTWTKWPTSDDDKLWLGAENINPATKTAYIRGNNTTISPNDSDYISFFQSGTSWHAGGNIMSLLRKKNFDTLTSVPDYCFYCLFINAVYMTAAPKMPATTVGAYAYYDMFNGCTALTAAPALPATTLGTSCYAYMFTGCTHMTTAPLILPATTLTDDCYRSMFQRCTALTAAPTLPATTLASGCYRNMFTVCSSLTTAPELPATQLVSSCYREMFKMCSSMNYIKALFTSTPGTETTDWVAGVATTGTFVKNSKATWTDVGDNAVPTGWTIETTIPNYLSFENLGNESVDISIERNNSAAAWPTYDLEFSYDNQTWYTWDISDSSTRQIGNVQTLKSHIPLLPKSSPEISNNPKSKVYIRGNNTTINATSYRNFVYIKFNHTQSDTNKKVAASGNIMSLLSKTGFEELTTIPNYCFCSLFMNCNTLTTAPEIPATTIQNESCSKMFIGCTALTTTPELTISSLSGSYCCYGMFKECTSLITANITSSAPTLTTDCYSNMFYGCTSLTTANITLSATTLALECCYAMFQGCTSLTTAPSILPAALGNYCYANMFNGCISLTTAPELPATTLVQSCYRNMFIGCSSLNYVKAMFTTIQSNGTLYWLSGVSATGTFVKNAAATWTDTGESAVPVGWTVTTASA